MTKPSRGGPSSGLAAGLDGLRAAVAGVAGMSAVMNLLTLAGPLFMLQVYDRVLPSRSVPTLIGLSIIALAAFAFLCGLDVLRGRLLVRIGRAFEQKAGPSVFTAALRARMRTREGDGLQPLRDLEGVRSFFASPGLAALFDLPWLPIYLLVCFVFHPLLGWSVLVGALLLSAVTIAGDRASRRRAADLVGLTAARRSAAETPVRNVELVTALGLAGRMRRLWVARSEGYLDRLGSTNDLSQGLAAISRSARIVLQSAVLGIGAWLVIRGEATPGIMLAATILATRALAPVDVAIGYWPALVEARLAWARLDELLRRAPQDAERTPLPRPSRDISVSSLAVAAPGSDRLVLADVTLSLAAGTALAVLGPSGSGKSSLARCLVGIWPAVRGVVRIDGAALDQWDPDALGAAVGYMSQDSVLFDGTVAENISRFAETPDPEALMRAAAAAGIHELVLRLPQGYETPVGEGGVALSGGQRQRIALARALYGEPFLLVLDEPNSNLDAEGEQALAGAIAGVRARGGIAVVIAHRASILAAVDQVLVLNGGRVQALGRRDDILRQLNAVPARRERPQSDAPAAGAVAATAAGAAGGQVPDGPGSAGTGTGNPAGKARAGGDSEAAQAGGRARPSRRPA